MDTKRDSLPISSIASCVLTNRFYFELITEFQAGLPKLVHNFVQQLYGNWDTMPERFRHQRLRLLGIEVIKKGDLHLLEIVSRLRFKERVGQQTVLRRVALPLQHTISSGRPDMLRWILTHGRDPHAHPQDLWHDAIAHYNGDFAVLEELKTLFPLCPADLDHGGEMQSTALMFYLLDIKLLQWVHQNLPRFTIPVRLMSEAAATGNLDVVAFLHETYPDVDFRRDMYCRAWTASAFDVLEYLLKHRHEPYSDRFLERVVDNGSLEVLQMVHRYRGLRVKPRFIELAGTCGHSAVQSFLVKRTIQ